MNYFAEEIFVKKDKKLKMLGQIVLYKGAHWNTFQLIKVFLTFYW